VGSTALREFMFKEKVRSILCGHIHNEEDVINTGVIPVSGPNRIVSNAAAVSNTSDQLFSGNIIEITETEILYTPGKFIQTVY
jgi:Icc-related predicted phosphoesterase